MRKLVTVAVGDSHEPRTVGPITQTDIVRFAGAGGDFNPLHHDPEFASRAGFPRIISMGQMQAGMLAAWVTDWFGVENLRSLEVRFVAPVMVGDSLTLRGAVTVVAPAPEGSLATVEVQATQEDGVVVVKGTAQVLVSVA